MTYPMSPIPESDAERQLFPKRGLLHKCYWYTPPADLAPEADYTVHFHTPSILSRHKRQIWVANMVTGAHHQITREHALIIGIHPPANWIEVMALVRREVGMVEIIAAIADHERMTN